LTCVIVPEKISIGCRRIDKFLGGGLSSESITLVYGEAETGKTALAMQCAISSARQGSKALFVDCDGAFSVRRLSQIASSGFEEVADLIILMKPTDFREQTVVVDQLMNYVARNFGLVVFDTITSLYRLRIAESPSKTFELNRELNRQLAVLAQVAKVQKVAVLATSQVYSVLDAVPVSIEPVATRVLKFWADTVFAMKPTENAQIIKLILEKSLGKVSAVTCNLRIDETGIHEYSTH
jgi:DNA repair and recombination protein RadB